MPFFAYMLECRDTSIYVGHTDDVPRRLDEHNAGKGAAWTRRRRPCRLLYFEEFATEQEATQRELQWKGWTKAKKLALASGNRDELQRLSKRRQSS